MPRGRGLRKVSDAPRVMFCICGIFWGSEWLDIEMLAAQTFKTIELFSFGVVFMTFRNCCLFSTGFRLGLSMMAMRRHVLNQTSLTDCFFAALFSLLLLFRKRTLNHAILFHA